MAPGWFHAQLLEAGMCSSRLASAKQNRSLEEHIPPRTGPPRPGKRVEWVQGNSQVLATSRPCWTRRKGRILYSRASRPLRTHLTPGIDQPAWMVYFRHLCFISPTLNRSIRNMIEALHDGLRSSWGDFLIALITVQWLTPGVVQLCMAVAH